MVAMQITLLSLFNNRYQRRFPIIEIIMPVQMPADRKLPQTKDQAHRFLYVPQFLITQAGEFLLDEFLLR